MSPTACDQTSNPTPATIGEQIRTEAFKKGRDYISSVVAAEYLGISNQTLKRWRVWGRGPRYQKISNEIRYYLADCDAWLEDQFVETGVTTTTAAAARA